MFGFEITGPYAGALLMSLGALCLFIWAVLSGAMRGADDVAIGVCKREMDNDDAKHYGPNG